MEKENKQIRAERLLSKCQQILKAEGIQASEKITGIKINDRIRSRLGSCRREGSSGCFQIEVSGSIMACDDRVIETVILHELLHTCEGCLNHGAKWKAYVARINVKYGYEINTTARYDQLGMEDPGSRETIKYRIICKNCGMEITRKRKCPLVEKTDRYRCGKCGGKLEIR